MKRLFGKKKQKDHITVYEPKINAHMDVAFMFSVVFELGSVLIFGKHKKT